MTGFSDPIYHNEDAARLHIETIRWPQGPYCPICGTFDKVSVLGGTSMGPGWYHCGVCRRKFTVRTGSVYERSHIPLHKWLHATALMAASKKGISAHQLHRMLGISYKAAWFMGHRIREAMRETRPTPMGGGGSTVVQADETYFGTRDEYRGKPWSEKKGKKMSVVALVEPGGRSRAFHVDRADVSTVRDILRKNVDFWSTLHTDERSIYKKPGAMFLMHESVDHSKGEYVRRTPGGKVHINNVENFFSVFKRGMRGVYQHCSEKHLQRYLDEFDFRYNNRASLGVDDTVRTIAAIKGAEGKRLLYRVS